MITLDAFMAGVQAIIDSKPTYKLGQDGSRGTCDCIGLIIGAIRRAGGTWSSTHGSNYAARHRMLTMKQPATIEVGAIVYKAFLPGEMGYNLPPAYSASPDQRDYYHVGVVLSVSPLRIAHCTGWGTGSGIKIDTTINRWRFGGRLKQIDYGTPAGSGGGGSPVSTHATVKTLTPGETVRMRSAPTASVDNVITNIRDGSEVFVLEQGGEWWKVNAQGKTGYMMSKFLCMNSDPSATPAETTMQLLLKAKALIEEAIQKERTS